MADLNRRLSAIEKRLRVGKEAESGPSVVTIGGRAEEHDPAQEHVQGQEEANSEHLKDHPGCLPKVIVLNLDANEEARRRSENKCQTLTED